MRYAEEVLRLSAEVRERLASSATMPGVLRIERDAFVEELRQRNIGTSVHFIPIHLHPYYRDKYGYRPESFPVALTNYRRMLSLPLSARVSDADAADVISAVLDIVRRYRR